MTCWFLFIQKIFIRQVFLDKKGFVFFMELYERIRLLAQVKNISLAKLAEYIDIYPQKFNQWLNEKSQKNLWEHLPKILDNFTDIRPEWLYYGEEPMRKDSAGLHVAVRPMTTAVPSLDVAMNAAGEPVEDDAALAAAGELAALRQKLLASYELNARLADANTRLTDEVLCLNAERRKLEERLAWEKMPDKIALSPLTVRGGTSEEH